MVFTIRELLDITWETQSRGACFCLASALQKLFYTVDKFPSIRLTQPTLVLWGNLDKTHRKTEKY